MNPQRRRLIGLTLGVVLTLVSIGVSTAILAYWHRKGWVAMSASPYLSSLEKKSPRPKTGRPKVLGYESSSVMMLMPHAPAADSGLRIGDHILSINGIPHSDTKALAALDARLKRGDTIVYRVERGDRTLDVPVRLESPLRHVYTFLQIVVSTIVGLIFVVIGWIVFSKRADDRRVTVFYAMTLVAGTSMMSATAAAINSGLRGINPEPGLSSAIVVLFLPLILAFLPLTLHLALIFPKERPIMRRVPKILRWVYGLAITGVVSLAMMAPGGLLQKSIKPGTPWRWIAIAVASVVLLAVLAALVKLLRMPAEDRFRAITSRPFIVFTSAILVVQAIVTLLNALAGKKVAAAALIFGSIVPFLLFLGMPILSCIVLYRSYRDANVEERRQLVWPLWGTIVALGFRMLVGIAGGIASAYAVATGGDYLTIVGIGQYFEIAARAMYVLIPVSFAVAIMKYRLMNIDVLIRKTVVYTILSGAIIFVYLVVVGGLGTILVRTTGLQNQTMVIAATLVVGLLFVPVRNKLQTLVDRNLFRHKYDYPAAIQAIAHDALGATDQSVFLSSAAEKLQQALQNRAVVMFVPRHDELVAVAKVGVADTLIGALRIAASSFVPLIDRPFDPRRRAMPDDAAAALKRIEAVLVVPINTPGTSANGFVALGSKLSGGDFDVEDIDFLRAVADQLDIGVDRIRMQRDDADYAQARAIQETLLPREMPNVSGIDVSGTWQPARTVGGDYYDLLKLSENELAIAIGDVAGKGMPAALLMSGLQAAVRASESRSPRELCERVRRVIVSSLSGGRFVTFFYAVLDTASMRIRWCNAGHNAPILVRGDGSIVRLAEGGPAFSRLMRSGVFIESELPIAPGDRLVLFTDGASEATNPAGDMFDEERIEQLAVGKRTLAAKELQQTIVEAVIAHAEGELEDDLTLVVAAITPPA